MKDGYKKVLFAILILALCMPQLQIRLFKIQESALNGVAEVKERPKLQLSSVISGQFQKEFEDYYTNHVGFRATLVRFYNELFFSIFHKSTNSEIKIGKDNILFEDVFIRSYFGKDYLGEAKIDSVVRRAKLMQDDLNKKGKKLLVVIAPNKVYDYSEYLPEQYKSFIRGTTNYSTFTSKAEASGISVVDFQRYFNEHKSNRIYETFPPYGIHWNAYSSTIATDSIVNALQGEHLKIKSNYKIERFVRSFNIKDPDDDLFKLLNISHAFPPAQLPYPVISFAPDSSIHRPSILTVGDSFYWNIANTKIFEAVFNGPHFWYYNNRVFPESATKELLVNQLNYVDQINNTDVLLIVASDANLVYLVDSVSKMYVQKFKL
jgi:SGNH hydrolase-like domain, acetyltransferase AlgX